MLSKNRIKFINSLKKKKFREKHRQFIIEGDKMVREFINSNYVINQIISTEKWLELIPSNLEMPSEKVEFVKPSELKKLSAFKTPANVLAIVHFQDYQLLFEEITENITIILDSINDPGNMGTIIRSASWFGINNIICSPDCVDIYNPKVLQATMGALCSVHVFYEELVPLLKKYSDETDFPIYGTFPAGNSIYELELSSKGFIILGNESRGISEKYLAFINQKLSIPSFPSCKNRAESLNVSTATAIILSEFRRRIRNL